MHVGRSLVFHYLHHRRVVAQDGKAINTWMRALADDLAAAVTLFLEKKFAGGIPSIEDIQDMVETVLQETDHTHIATAYVAYRKKRSQIREILQVHKDGGEGPQVEAGSHEATVPWRKARIVAALVKEADLEVSVAEAIASAVEEKVFRSGLRRIGPRPPAPAGGGGRGAAGGADGGVRAWRIRPGPAGR